MNFPRKIYPRICAGVKTAKSKVASTKQFVENRTLDVGERAGSGIAADLRLGVSFFLLCLGAQLRWSAIEVSN